MRDSVVMANRIRLPSGAPGALARGLPQKGVVLYQRRDRDLTVGYSFMGNTGSRCRSTTDGH